MEKNGIWTETFKVTASMVNPLREVSLVAICSRLQEVAGNHAAARQVGYHHMAAKQLFWALSRLNIEIIVYPKWNESIQIQTWVQSMKGPFSQRNFQLTNGSKEVIGFASTLWTVVDSVKRRLASIPDSDFPVFPDKPVPCGTPEKIRFECVSVNPFVLLVHYSDLDMIHHMNNVKYLEHIFNTYDWSLKSTGPSRLEVNYLGEAFLGDKLHIFSRMVDSYYQHCIYNQDRSAEILRARIKW